MTKKSNTPRHVELRRLAREHSTRLTTLVNKAYSWCNVTWASPVFTGDIACRADDMERDMAAIQKCIDLIQNHLRKMELLVVDMRAAADADLRNATQPPPA